MDEGRGWLRAAAACAWLTALGFGGPCAWAIWQVTQTGVVPTLLGFPVYGGGPFEDLGFPTTLPLLVGFLATCLLELVAGIRLWLGRPDGAALAMLALAPGALFWWGFALPVAPVVAVVRTVCVAVGMQTSRRSPRAGRHTGRPQPH